MEARAKPKNKAKHIKKKENFKEKTNGLFLHTTQPLFQVVLTCF